MNILMVTSETVPFSKSGGLADVVGALSSSLVKNGDTVKVFMPGFSFIDQSDFKEVLKSKVSILSKIEDITITSTIFEGVEYLALNHPYFTERKGIYGDTSFTPYSDNAIRWSFFSKAVFSYLEDSGWQADIIHAHDWTTGIVPYIVKTTKYPAKTMFTIHNLAYQGEFSRYDLILADIIPSAKMLNGEGLDKRYNMLKTGIVYSDIVTTVSPTYANEIQECEQGCQLDDLLRERKSSLFGIINGIDYNEWNPETDKFLKKNTFTSKKLANKYKLKKEIQKDFGLEENKDIPLISMISRLADQKGFSELLDGTPCTLEQLLSEENVQFAIVGTGDKKFEDKLTALSFKYPNLGVKIVFSNEIAHRLEAASDFFLMPSRYEPCGLNQLYSLHYGTLPIATKTGGLADSIIDLNENKENGNGFLFSPLSANNIYKTVKQALEFYNIKDELKKAIVRGMETDFSWGKSAEAYQELYRQMKGGDHHEAK